MLKRRVNHRQMAIAEIRFWYRGLEGLHFLCLWVQPNDLHLRHVAEVNPSFLINIDLQTALSDLSEPVLRNPILDHFAGFGIELSNKLRITIRIPDVPLPIKHLVMS